MARGLAASSLVVLVLLASCTSTVRGKDTPGGTPLAGTCAGTVVADPSCEGQVCLPLKPNVQGKAGICSADCAAGVDACGGKAVCAPVPNPSAPGTTASYCFKLCSDTSECSDGFECLDQGGVKICFVTTTTDTGATSSGTTPAVSCDTCDHSSTDEGDITTFCAGTTPVTNRVCVCPDASPGIRCRKSAQEATTYCCP